MNYSEIDFTCQDTSIEGFVNLFGLQKEAEKLWGKDWTPDGDVCI